jgi:glyoxalase family protein
VKLTESTESILGVHHVTAVASDPQRNIDFYTGLLGLRLVKLTVNYDDPETYHLYYGDQVGHPGTILTFFPWPRAPQGQLGTGLLTVTSFAIPEASIDYWSKRLESRAVSFQGPTRRFDERVVSFSDPDGLRLELVAYAGLKDDDGDVWTGGTVPREHAIRGFFGVTLSEEALGSTASLLTETMGFRKVSQRDGRSRFAVGSGGLGSFVDVLSLPGIPNGAVGVGTVHHVAWRTPDNEQQNSWRTKLVGSGLNVTPVIDRKYFHSIYFHEPGGVLFEIATDPPGFTVDEAVQQLGSRLSLPPWLEPRRDEIQHTLPRVRVPTVARIL